MMRLWHGTICRFDLPVVSLGMLVIFPLLLLHKYNQVIIIMFSFNSSSCTTSTTTKSSSLQILLTWQSRNVGKDKDKEMQTKTKPNTKTMTLHDETAESRCLQMWEEVSLCSLCSLRLLCLPYPHHSEVGAKRLFGLRVITEFGD